MSGRLRVSAQKHAAVRGLLGQAVAQGVGARRLLHRRGRADARARKDARGAPPFFFARLGAHVLAASSRAAKGAAAAAPPPPRVDARAARRDDDREEIEVRPPLVAAQGYAPPQGDFVCEDVADGGAVSCAGAQCMDQPSNTSVCGCTNPSRLVGAARFTEDSRRLVHSSTAPPPRARARRVGTRSPGTPGAGCSSPPIPRPARAPPPAPAPLSSRAGKGTRTAAAAHNNASDYTACCAALASNALAAEGRACRAPRSSRCTRPTRVVQRLRLGPVRRRVRRRQRNRARAADGARALGAEHERRVHARAGVPTAGRATATSRACARLRQRHARRVRHAGRELPRSRRRGATRRHPRMIRNVTSRRGGLVALDRDAQPDERRVHDVRGHLPGVRLLLTVPRAPPAAPRTRAPRARPACAYTGCSTPDGARRRASGSTRRRWRRGVSATDGVKGPPDRRTPRQEDGGNGRNGRKGGPPPAAPSSNADRARISSSEAYFAGE